ncbi:MAG: dihydroorotate dehydrogenase [Deltaproteobacteria bacterium]|nr:dihydroorotate dehydrogenase [Deltaproteobacteria bacterium]
MGSVKSLPSIKLLESKVGSVEFKTPLLAASGTWAYGLEFLNHPLQKFLGGFVTKSLSVKSSEGNPMPRLYETESGMLNSIGLQNMGIDAFIQNVEPQLKAAKSSYVLSVYAQRVEDFKILAEKANACSAVAIEINISCPNIDKGGLEFSSDPKTTAEVVSQVKAAVKKPLWVKLSPNVTSISDIAVAAESAGADAISMINTLLGMSINIDSKKPWLGRKMGGLSGPAIRPVAIERVYRTYSKIKIPIVGMGGITSSRDVIEFLLAGATVVQIGTWNFRDPFCYEKMSEEIARYLQKNKFSSVQELIGLAHR